MAKRKIIPLFVPHAGCPNACVFCDQKKITGAQTPVTPEQARREIEAGLVHGGRDCELAFYGGSFTAMAPEVQEGLLQVGAEFLSRGDLGAIRISTRPDAVEEETVQRLKKYGVSTVELGSQSMDDRVLHLANRGHGAEDTERAVKRLKAHGFRVILQMMTGLPGDDGSQSVETARTIIALKPDGVRIYPTVVLKGTELERQMNCGDYTPHSVEAAVELCATLYEMFLAEGIPVIRVGLNPTELLSDGAAVAGAYHPALGEMVLSRMYLRRAEALLRQAETRCQAEILVHPSRVSVMVGQKRSNIAALEREFNGISIKVRPEARELWEIALKKQ